MFSNRLSRIKSGGSADDNEVDITPMLDVVFIMLIFFVVTASFVKESGFGLNKPRADVSSEMPDAAPIVVEIGANNEIKIQGIEIVEAAIKATIVRLRAESPDSTVLVKMHPDSNTSAMVAAVDSIRAANVLMPSLSLIET